MGIKLFPKLVLESERSDPRAALRDAVENSLILARKLYPYDLPMPKLDFSLRGSCAGKAFYREWMLKFNLDYMNNYWDDMISNTAPHEVAHLVSFKIYGLRGVGHGIEWQNVAQNLGCSARRCHSYEVISAKKTRKFIYDCNCLNGCQVGLNIHRKIQSGLGIRICSNCSQHLYPKSSFREIYESE